MYFSILSLVGAENERHEIDMFLSCTHLSGKGDADISCVISGSSMGDSMVAYCTSQASKWPGVYLPALRNWWSGLLAGRNLAAHPADEVASSSYSLVSDAGFADVVASCSCGLLDC
ncbi:uncharacterized protein LOC125941583 isoform X1 [Dermacentor silvarum]|uniref:uncharacterized protein LOC125941583 isoform X1 n=1 Tax=Dermacentor silvarum TaxID=543639 RepID=UPI002100D97A|nr:uncharacterized protein LOC125941583 isoform X1 [Dermacentor silvarum]